MKMRILLFLNKCLSSKKGAGRTGSPNRHAAISMIGAAVFALIFASFPAKAGALAFSDSPAPEFQNVRAEWKNSTTEVDAKFRGLDAAGAKKLEEHLGYLFLHEDDFNFILPLMGRSDNEFCVAILKKILFDENEAGVRKRAAISALGQAISRPGAAGAARSLKEYLKTPECQASESLCLAVLSTLAGDKSDEGFKFFLEEFSSQKSVYMREKLVSYLASYGPKSFDALKSEFEACSKTGDHEYLKKITGLLPAADKASAYKFLEAEIAKIDRDKTGSVIFDKMEEVMASTGEKAFLPVIEKYASSRSVRNIERGMKLLDSFDCDTAIVNAYSYYTKKAADDPGKRTMLKMVGSLVYEKFRYAGNTSAETVSAVDSILADAISCDDDPALVRNAFKTLVACMPNAEFAKKAAARTAGPNGFLYACAMAACSDTGAFDEQMKKPDFIANAAKYSYCLADVSGRFPVKTEALAADGELLKSYLRFAKVQQSYFRMHIVEKIIDSKDPKLVRAVVDFVRDCSKDFVSGVKYRIRNDEAWILSTGDEEIIKFSGLFDEGYFEKMKQYSQTFDSCKDDLKLYLSKIDLYDQGERKFAAAKVKGLLKASFDRAGEILRDEMTPFGIKSFLTGTIISGFGDLKASVPAAVFEEILALAEEDCEISVAACQILKKIDARAAYPKIVDALNKSLNDPYRAGRIVRELGEYKTPENAKFLIDTFVVPRALFDEGNASEGQAAAPVAGADFVRDVVYMIDSMGDTVEAVINECVKKTPSASIYFTNIRRSSASPETFRYHIEKIINGEKAPKEYRENFDYLSRYGDDRNIPVMIETYKKLKPSDARGELIMAALFRAIGVEGPAAKFCNSRKFSEDPALLALFSFLPSRCEFVAEHKKAGRELFELFKKSRKSFDDAAALTAVDHLKFYGCAADDADFLISEGPAGYSESALVSFASRNPAGFAALAKKNGKTLKAAIDGKADFLVRVFLEGSVYAAGEGEEAKKAFCEAAAAILKDRRVEPRLISIAMNLDSPLLDFVFEKASKGEERMAYLEALSAAPLDARAVKFLAAAAADEKAEIPIVCALAEVFRKNYVPSLAAALMEKAKAKLPALMKETGGAQDVINGLIRIASETDIDPLYNAVLEMAKSGAVDFEYYVFVSGLAGKKIDASLAGYSSMDAHGRVEFAARVQDRGIFELAAFGADAPYYSVNFDALSGAKTPDMKIVDSILAAPRNKKDFNYGNAGTVIRNLFFYKLLKSPEDEKLKLVLAALADESDQSNRNFVAEYFENYRDDNLARALASKFLGDLKAASENGTVLRAVSFAADPAALASCIESSLDKKEASIPPVIFTAYARSADPKKAEVLSKAARSERYRYEALEAIRGMGREGFAILKALFEAAAADPKNYYADNYIDGMGRTGRSEAAGFLITLIGTEKKEFERFREKAVSELGATGSKEAFDWLVKNAGDAKYRVFYPLSQIARGLILDFVEAEKGAAGKTKVMLASILLMNGVKKPFLAILAGSVPDVIEAGREVLPPLDYVIHSRSETGTISKKLLQASIKSISAELGKTDFSKLKDDYRKSDVYNYLTGYLGYSENAGDADLLIKIIYADPNGVGRTAADSLVMMGGPARGKTIDAASKEGNPDAVLETLIRVLERLEAREAAPIFIAGLRSKKQSVVEAAASAVGRLKLVQSIPVLVDLLGGESSNSARYALGNMGEAAFGPVLDAMMQDSKAAAAYMILGSVAGEKLGELEAQFEARYRSSKRAGFLIAMFLANSRKPDKLRKVLADDPDALLMTSGDICPGSSAIKEVGKVLVDPAVRLLSKSGEYHHWNNAMLILETLADPDCVPRLRKLMSEDKDEYHRQRIYKLLAAISGDKLALFLETLENEKNYSIRYNAAKSVEQLAASSPELAPKLLKLFVSESEASIQAIYAGILGNLRHADAVGPFMEKIKKSRRSDLLEACALALPKVGSIEQVRDSLKSVLAGEEDLNAAIAARIFGLFEDSKSVDLLNAQLLSSLKKNGGYQKKLELIKALAAIGSESSAQALSKATASREAEVRENARMALSKILGPKAASFFAPDPPASLRSRGGDGVCRLSWKAPENKPVEKYIIYRDGAKMPGDGVKEPSFDDSGLKNGKMVRYCVAAVDAEGNEGALSDEASATPSKPPGPVTSLKLIPDETTIELRWEYSPAADKETGLASFVIERNGRKAATLGREARSFKEYGLSSTRRYNYRIYGVNGFGCEGEAASVTGTAGRTR